MTDEHDAPRDRPPATRRVLPAKCHSAACPLGLGAQDFHEGSDLDLLVEFEPGQTSGLAFFTMPDDLSALLGRRVDLHTAASLSPLFRDELAQSAKVLCGAG